MSRGERVADGPVDGGFLLPVGETWRSSISVALSGSWPYLLGALMALVAKAPTLSNGLLNVDEVYYLFEGQKLNSLHRFIYSFEYNPEYKLPLGLLPYIAAGSISHEWAPLFLHIFGFVAVLASVLLLVLISRTAFSTPVPGLAATLLWLSYLNHGWPSAAPLLEYYQVPFLLGATWLFMQARRGSGKRSRLALSGLCVGVAALVKPPGLVLAPVLSVVVLSEWPAPPRQRVGQALVLCASAAAPVAVFVLPYLLNSEALAAIRSGFLQPVGAYVAAVPLSERFMRLAERSPGESLIVAVVVVVRILRSGRLFLGHTFQRLSGRKVPSHLMSDASAEDLRVSFHKLLLYLGCALFAGYLTGAGFGQYLVPVIPFTALFITYWFIDSYRKQAGMVRRVAFATLIIALLVLPDLPNVGYYTRLFGDNGRMYMSTMQGVDTWELVRYVKANSKPGDSIWVYFAAPEIYWLSNREPATDDPWGEAFARNNPAKMRDSVERDQPVLIIGIDEPRFPPEAGTIPLKSLPAVKDLLAMEYKCYDNLVAGTTICKRNDVAEGKVQ